MKLLISGRTGSGKDTLREALEAHGLSFVTSSTDRARRENEGDTHHFVTTEEMDAIWDGAICRTEIAGHRYATTTDDLAAADAYIVDRAGILDVCEALPDEALILVYIQAYDGPRRHAAATRGDAAEDRDAREHAEKEDFARLEDEILMHELPRQIAVTIKMTNDYQPTTIEVWSDEIMGTWRAFKQLVNIVEASRSIRLFESGEGDPNRIRVSYQDGSVKELTPEIVAAELLTNENAFRDILMGWLAIPHPETRDLSDYR